MRFVLDNSVVMRWLLNDGSEDRPAYAGKVLEYLELALREGLPLATLDADLRFAMQKTGCPEV
jgi:hypothetical protein